MFLFRRNNKQEEPEMNFEQIYSQLPAIEAGRTADRVSLYTDKNKDCAVIPAGFTVSAKEDEKTEIISDINQVLKNLKV